MRIILITTSSFGSLDSGPKDLIEAVGFALRENPFGRTLTEGEVRALLEEHKPVGMIAGVEPLTAGVLQGAAEHLKVISRCGAGLDSVDSKSAKELGIAVYNTPDAPCEAVAELTVGMMLCLIRNINGSDRLVRSGNWKKPMGFLLGELTVGILGLGRIGKRVAVLVSRFGARVVAADIVSDEAWAKQHGVRLMGRTELLQVADIVSLHLPYSSGDLHHVIGATQLASMKPGSYLLNTSRGGLVDEQALFESLKSGHLRGASLDTYEQEPYRGPLCELDNVILTPHVGSYARAARVRMESEAVTNLIKGLKEQGIG